MRTPQTCSNTSRGPVSDQHHTEDGGESVASHKTQQSGASSTSFSLQERINDFRARRIHRSSQSNQNTDDDLINQNKSNKHNERISKPCKDGFCYCFTSDSDDFRIYRSDEKKRSRRSETIEQISDMPKSKHKVRRRETFPLHSKQSQNTSPCKVKAVSKLEDSNRNLDAPLIHIIQEIHNNCVVSEVRVNKHKISGKYPPRKRQMVPEQKVINVQTEIPLKTIPSTHAGQVSDIDSLVEDFQESSLNTSSKKCDKNGGRLLRKRLSGTKVEYKPRNLSTPPRKPPRNVSSGYSEKTLLSTAPSVKEAEQILDDFLRGKGISVPQFRPTHKSNRKSFPLTKKVELEDQQYPAYEKPLPSCPSISDIEQFGSIKPIDSCGEVREDIFTWNNPKIREMLNLDTKTKNFQSNHPECGPQVGWTVPPKLDIDTVDGAYHNLVANMESKCTPVKNEMLSNKTESQKFILAEQLKNFVSNSPWSSKKSKDKHNIKKSNSFLSASKTKLLRFVAKKSPTGKNIKSRSVGVQTSTKLVVDLQKQLGLSSQSGPDSYFSNTPGKVSKSSQTEFDFSRTIHSPKREKVPSRKLIFPTPNCLKESTSQTMDLDRNQNQTYRSFNSGLDKDLTLSKMGQLLGNIRSRLEASDELAVGIFRDIKRKEAAAAAFSYDCVDGYEYQRVCHLSAQADVHNEVEPSYSEIEEDSFIITGSPVADNTNGIEHFIVDNDPKAIYAKINKTPKKSKSHTQFFNNIMEQDSSPKLRNFSKTDLSVQSEIFLENLTSENNGSLNNSFEKAQKVPNTHQEEKSYCDANDIDDSYASVDCFRESIAKESDSVSYELPNDNSNPINEENVTGNQSTPKKAIHLSKFGIEITSDDGHLQTVSCPATPGWLQNDETHCSREDESMSLREESTIASGVMSNSRLWKYRNLKDKLRQSIRKSKKFLKTESKRIANSLNSPKTYNLNESDEPWDESSLCIANLFSMDDVPVKDQLTQAVSICRLIPELEVSPEMVEAERLLLFSTLKRECKNTNAAPKNDNSMGVIALKSFRFPINNNNGQELFFNYYYIGVFSSDGEVKSTQSAICKNEEAIFRDCSISFENIKCESEIHCDIFMLRLRKVTTSRKSPSVAKKLSQASTSSEEILSRFRPYASFVVRPRDFVPYELVENCPNTVEGFNCLHTVKSCEIAIIPQTQSANVLGDVQISAAVELLFRKYSKRGFLNVQDFSKKHNWNLRWCEMDSFRLVVWDSPNIVSEKEPVFTLDLRKCTSHPVKYAPKEVCARSRSLSLDFDLNQTSSTYMFSADNQSDLNYWISALNEVLEFIKTWMK